LDWPTAAEEMQRLREIDRKAEAMLASEEWWDIELCGINGITNMLPAALARVMANLDKACSGEQIGRDAITTALSQVQRVARQMAREQAENEDYGWENDE